jgi:transposase-like protein
MMDSVLFYLEGIFMAKKGQSFQKYTEELKPEAVRLRLEERKSLRYIREQLGVKSDAQMAISNCGSV